MITIGYSTRETKPEFQEHIRKTCMSNNVQIIEKINNGEKSLSQVYNEIIQESTNDIIVLCHDDLIFETKNWGKKLLSNYEKSDYGIVGLAGSVHLPESGKWWESRIMLRGIVNHQKDGKKWESKYSPNEGKISNVVVVDGLFISFDKRKIKKSFDETMNGFHFYDLSFSFSNHLEGVKVGVTYDVRVTHLSIGETNDQWEENRIFFVDKYKSSLPSRLEENDDNLTTYVMCHDQSIIKSNIKSNKYGDMGKLVFMYVGKGEFLELEKYPNVIIVRNLKHNIEQYPKFTAFTAWYSIWRHGLCKTKYINLLEYDTQPKEDFSFFLKNFLKHNPKIVSYFPLTMRNYHYIDNPDWVSTLFKAIKLHYKIDIEPLLRNVISDSLKQNRDPMWGTTNNVCFEYTTFDKYMRWVSPLINYLKDDINCGHAQERAVTFYSILNKVPVSYFSGLIEHLQLDSHKTQGHEVDYEKSVEILTGLSNDEIKKKNAIVVLSRGYDEIYGYNSLIKRNIHIFNNIVSKVDEEFDIIIYHEGNISENHQLHISSVTPQLPLKFINVKTSELKNAFDDRKNLVNMDLCPPTPQSKAFPLGYKHMCHFWSIDFIGYLKDYEYIIRIDEDCFVSEFNSNLLKEMKSNDVHFVSPYFQGQDDDYVIVGMEKLWKEFIFENNLIPLKDFGQITCPYTNFMVVNVKYLNDNEIINKMLKKIDESHGIYSNRWGDLPIWGMILSTLVDEKHYSETKKISYFHGSHNKMINN